MISTTEQSNKNFNLISDYWKNHASIRLAACLFIVIFLAQALWIYPAQKQFEREELNRLSYTGLAIMESLLTLASSHVAPEDIALLGQTLSHNTPLKGARMYTHSGELLLEFGETPVYEPYHLQQQWQHWISPSLENGTRVEMAWLPKSSYSSYLIVARLDSEHITTGVNHFLEFLLKMVFTVTGVATLLLMWILRKPQLRNWVEKVTGVEELKPSPKIR